LLGLAWSSPLAFGNGPQLELELGGVYASSNDVKVPGDSGTRFSLTDDLSTSIKAVGRIRAGYRFWRRHLVSVLYAPLKLEPSGEFDRDVSFAGVNFPAGESIRAVYRFDSYRVTYRYSLLYFDDLELAVGATAKIRDAEIRLTSATAVAKKTNRGFVPLANLHFAWRPGRGQFGVLIDVDALAAPQGRAEDVLVAATWAPRHFLSLYAGYRTLEGGADNENVYTFAWLHYAVAGFQLHF
jgi:hypothetical protein